MRRIPLGALLLSHTARIWELIVLQALAGTGTAFFNPASTGLTPMTVSAGRLQQHVPPASLSRVSAYDWFGSLLCQPLGLALAGVAAAGIGMSRTLWIAAAVDLAAVAAILAAPSVRHLQRVGEPQLGHSAQQAVAD